jgi:hypothetical protein
MRESWSMSLMMRTPFLNKCYFWSSRSWEALLAYDPCYGAVRVTWYLCSGNILMNFLSSSNKDDPALILIVEKHNTSKLVRL